MTKRANETEPDRDGRIIEGGQQSIQHLRIRDAFKGSGRRLPYWLRGMMQESSQDRSCFRYSQTSEAFGGLDHDFERRILQRLLQGGNYLMLQGTQRPAPVRAGNAC